MAIFCIILTFTAIKILRETIALDAGNETAVTTQGLLLAETGELDEAA
jgi:hypothetical protein